MRKKGADISTPNYKLGKIIVAAKVHYLAFLVYWQAVPFNVIVPQDNFDLASASVALPHFMHLCCRWAHV